MHRLIVGEVLQILLHDNLLCGVHVVLQREGLAKKGGSLVDHLLTLMALKQYVASEGLQRRLEAVV